MLIGRRRLRVTTTEPLIVDPAPEEIWLLLSWLLPVPCRSWGRRNGGTLARFYGVEFLSWFCIPEFVVSFLRTPRFLSNQLVKRAMLRMGCEIGVVQISPVYKLLGWQTCISVFRHDPGVRALQVNYNLYRIARMSTAQPLKKLVSGVVLDLDGTLLNTGGFFNFCMSCPHVIPYSCRSFTCLSIVKTIHEMSHFCHLCICMCFLYRSRCNLNRINFSQRAIFSPHNLMQ